MYSAYVRLMQNISEMKSIWLQAVLLTALDYIF